MAGIQQSGGGAAARISVDPENAGAFVVEADTRKLILDGATDTAMFTAFVECFLLKKLKPRQIVIMDNLSAHKSP